MAQILTAAQMKGAEDVLIAGGVGVDALMQRAGRGAAELVWRMAGPDRRVTVLTGPGNNGGDGWVIAQALHERGGRVVVVPACEPKTAAAIGARGLYCGPVADGVMDGVAHGAADGVADGDILVDCLFGTGLTRGLEAGDLALLGALAGRHGTRIALDLPSGVESDSGGVLNGGLPDYQLTIALGAWKRAHFLMPAAARMGALRLVEIGCGAVEGAGAVIARPHLRAPAAGAHKYTRGLLGVVAGAMPGAAMLAARAAQGAGAGYVKLLSDGVLAASADLVVERGMGDARLSALLVGPGLGRDAGGHFLMAEAMGAGRATVLDADALHLLSKGISGVIATPHEGEMAAMERYYALAGEGDKIARALAVARASGMVIVAKGPDTIVAAPDGRWAAAERASSWLSTAGTGDVLAGTVASRLACGVEPFQAACEGVWLHGEAARQALAPFSAGELANSVAKAYRACL